MKVEVEVEMVGIDPCVCGGEGGDVLKWRWKGRKWQWNTSMARDEDA